MNVVFINNTEQRRQELLSELLAWQIVDKIYLSRGEPITGNYHQRLRRPFRRRFGLLFVPDPALPSIRSGIPRWNTRPHSATRIIGFAKAHWAIIHLHVWSLRSQARSGTAGGSRLSVVTRYDFILNIPMVRFSIAQQKVCARPLNACACLQARHSQLHACGISDDLQQQVRRALRDKCYRSSSCRGK